MRLYKNLLVGRILSCRPLLLVAIGRGRNKDPSPRPFPPRRQETWGIVAELSYLDIHRCG